MVSDDDDDDEDDVPATPATPVATTPAVARNNVAPGPLRRMLSGRCRRPATAAAVKDEVPRPDRRADDATDCSRSRPVFMVRYDMVPVLRRQPK
mmetsp:Transcript_22588/g.47120  ORF Transcript_22588/g.47120 Transcript_22588/m.47120 type:complete len:94 (-) Transcript_22588:71-352(-)